MAGFCFAMFGFPSMGFMVSLERGLLLLQKLVGILPVQILLPVTNTAPPRKLNFFRGFEQVVA